MSDVINEQRPVSENVDRAYFLSDERAAENIEILRDHLSSYHSAKIPGTSPPEFGPRLPRYGVHSMLAMKTRFFAYDHPAVMQKCQTAFTNGSQVWFSAPFLNAMVDEFKKDNGRTASAFLVGLHEISHILDNHISRSYRIFDKYKALYPDAPEKSIHSMINIGMDIIINQRLVAAFEELVSGDIFKYVAWGLAESHQKYKGWSEEAVVQDLFTIAEKQDEQRLEQKKQQQEQQDKKDQQQQKDNQDNQDEKGDPKEEENPEDGQPKPDEDGEKGDKGEPTPEDGDPSPGDNGIEDPNGKPVPGDNGEEDPNGKPKPDPNGQEGDEGEASVNAQEGKSKGKSAPGKGEGSLNGDGDAGGQPDPNGKPGKGDPTNGDPVSDGEAGEPSDGQDPANGSSSQPQEGKPSEGHPGAPGGGMPSGEPIGGDFGELPTLQKSLEGNDFSDIMTPEEFVKTALENGLEESLRKLGMIPDDMTVEEMLDGEDGELLSRDMIDYLRGLEKDRARTIDNTINEAYADMRRNGGKYPGAHLLEAAAFKVRERQKPKLTWIMEAENNINGGLGNVLTSYDNLSDISMFNPDDMNMIDAPIMEGTTPAEPDIVVAGIVDTSGSMTDEILSEMITEAAQLVRKYRARLVLFSADTTVRAEPIVITPENIDEIISDVGIDMFGRGGTNLEGSLRLLDDYDCIDLVNSISMVPSARTDKYPDAILYFTDLFDGIPRQSKLSPELHKTIFICPKDSPVNLMDEYKSEGWSLYPVLDEKVININRPNNKRLSA